ncbi:MAG: hypothetical protein ABI771_08160 [Betaproteobacteria bacterium]
MSDIRRFRERDASGFGNDCPVIFSTHRAGPLIADNRMRSGSSGSLSVGQVQACGFPGKFTGALFFGFYSGIERGIQLTVNRYCRAPGKVFRCRDLLVSYIDGRHFYTRDAEEHASPRVEHRIDSPMSLPDSAKETHWFVKDTATSEWRVLPGVFSTTEMLRMRIEGFFAAAVPADDLPPDGGASPS